MFERIEPDEQLTAFYDTSLGQVGCVIIQALGGDRRVAQMFDTPDWFLTPTPGMKRFTATQAFWQGLANLTREERIELHKGGSK